MALHKKDSTESRGIYVVNSQRDRLVAGQVVLACEGTAKAAEVVKHRVHEYHRANIK